MNFISKLFKHENPSATDILLPHVIRLDSTRPLASLAGSAPSSQEIIPMSFGFQSIQHFWASAMHDIHVAAQAVEKEIPKLEKDAPVVEGLSALIPGVGSEAVIIERAAFQALGNILPVVNDADASAQGGGLSVSLDKQTVADFKALLAQFKDELSQFGIGSSKPAATAPTPPPASPASV